MKKQTRVGVANPRPAPLALIAAALMAAAPPTRQPEKPQGNRAERRRQMKGKRR